MKDWRVNLESQDQFDEKQQEYGASMGMEIDRFLQSYTKLVQDAFKTFKSFDNNDELNVQMQEIITARTAFKMTSEAQRNTGW